MAYVPLTDTTDAHDLLADHNADPEAARNTSTYARKTPAQ
jgi:hypothetical protein